MESDIENNSFVQIFGSNNTFTEKSLDFNSEKYAKPNDMNFLPKDLEQNNFLMITKINQQVVIQIIYLKKIVKKIYLKMKNQLKLLIMMMNLINIIQMKFWK